MAREHAMNPGDGHGPNAFRPRVLLVEDDPASRLFLAVALEAMPTTVVAAGSVMEALRLVANASSAFDLWLVDANLPDGSGAGLLRELRARDPATPAIAHTASTERDALDALLAAGFAEVLVKPLQAALLQASVRRVLGLAGPVRVTEPPVRCGKLPVWDDDAAAAALGGDPVHVAALRSLFLAELPGQRDAVLEAFDRGDAAAAAAELHRLQAGCGFTGAARLAAAVERLRARMDSSEALAGFAHAAQDAIDSAG